MFSSTLLAPSRVGRILARNAWKWWPWTKKVSGAEKQSEKFKQKSKTPILMETKPIQLPTNDPRQFRVGFEVTINVKEENIVSDHQIGKHQHQWSFEELRQWYEQHVAKKVDVMECFICEEKFKRQNMTAHVKKCAIDNDFWQGEAKLCPELAEALENNEIAPLSDEEREECEINLKRRLHEEFPHAVANQFYVVYLRFDEEKEERSIENWIYVGKTGDMRYRMANYKTNNDKKDVKCVYFLDGLSSEGASFLEYILMQMRDFPKIKNGNVKYEFAKSLPRQPNQNKEFREFVLPLLIDRIYYGKLFATAQRRKLIPGEQQKPEANADDDEVE